jgi:hypothetical protein
VTILDAFEIYLSKPVASSKSDRKLAKNYYLLQEHTKTSKNGKWSKSCFVQGFAYKQKQKLLKSQ